ncbi:MAG: 3-deoxy-manno-octulosonate cytidylyltransferase [Mucinivorans sp.]
MNKFTAIIPARYASSRFPGKPLAMIGDKTMIARVYERASQCFSRAVVATDDERIFDHVRSFGGQVVMTRSDHRSGTDRVAEAVEKIGAAGDIIINIQGDEPFISMTQLEQIKSLFDDPTCQIATLVKPFAADEDIFNPNAVKAIFSPQMTAVYFSRSAIPYLRGVESSQWAARHIYYRHVGLYGYRGEVLARITQLEQSPLEQCESLEQLRWLESGYKIKVAITNEDSYGVDTPEDLALLNDRYASKENKKI